MSAWTKLERREMMLAEAKQRFEKFKAKPMSEFNSNAIAEYESTIARLEAEIAEIKKESDGR
jgi:glutaredoxin 2